MFQKWIYKAAIQKAISVLPFANQINFQFQKYVTKGLELSDFYFIERLQHAANQIKAYKRHSGKSFPAFTLELGTGWYMIIPVCYFLCGAQSVYTIDLLQLANKKRLLLTLKKFIAYYELKKLQHYIPIKENRIEVLKNIIDQRHKLSFNEMIKQLNLTYFIGDVSTVSLKNNSIDLIHSNNTLEFINTVQLKVILIKFKALLKVNEGVLCNFIDLSDHYSHFDTSISNFNFLKYSDSKWKLIDNNLKRQNRLRITDYRAIYLELNIPVTEEINTDGNMDELMKINLSENYKLIPIKDLAVIHTCFISKM